MAKSGFVLAASGSGSGKTTFTIGLLAALRRLGQTVQPFKVGPDYIDPMYHRAACGGQVFGRNLDAFMLPEPALRYLFAKNARPVDVALVEGVMGLYDGLGPDSIEASSAHISQMLGLPVVLLINARGMSLSLAALLNGFRDFARQKSGQPLRLAGVLLNNIKTEMSFQYAKGIIERECGLPVFGWLPDSPEFALSERHLGLYCSGEVADLQQKIDLLADKITANCDLPGLLAATEYTQPSCPPPDLPEPLPQPVPIALAQDAAFNFYYQDSLDLLEELGAELIPFSPLRDKHLPEGAAGLLLGGGYPELNLPELSANRSLLEEIRQKLLAGLPCYGECGGFIYLGRSMTMEGQTWPLVGLFPFAFAMTNRLQHFGYLEAEIRPGTSLTYGESQPLTVRGHEFHYTQRQEGEEMPPCYQVRKPRGQSSWQEGWQVQNTLGAYPHFNFWANPRCAKNFLQLCAGYQNK